MKMIKNMAFYFGGKFYATQGGPLRLGYSVTEGQLPADWDTKVITNYPQKLTKDTIQFTLIDSDACGITGKLSDFEADDADAMCAKELRLYVVIGDETSGIACDPTAANIGVLCARSCNAYVVTSAPSSITVEGERVETLTVTFRTTTPFALMTAIPDLTVPIYEKQFDAGTYACDRSDRAAGDFDLAVKYGDTLVDIPVTDVTDGPAVEGKTFVGLADCEGKLYFTAPVATAVVYTPAVVKWDRLVPISLHYKYIASA